VGNPVCYPNTYIDPVDQCHLSRGRTCGLKNLVANLVKTSGSGKRVCLVSTSKSKFLQPIKTREVATRNRSNNRFSRSKTGIRRASKKRTQHLNLKKCLYSKIKGFDTWNLPESKIRFIVIH
jgi:hypothetical protein